jgi:hypothetical protein
MSKFIPLEGYGEAKDDSKRKNSSEVKEEETETKKAVKGEMNAGVKERRKLMANKMGKHKGGGSGKEPSNVKRIANKSVMKERD